MGSRLFLQDFPRRLQARPFALPSLPPPKARMGAHTQALRMAASTRLSRKITRLRAVTGRSPFMRRTVLPSMARIGRPQVRGKVRHTPSAVHAARGRGQVRRFCQQIGIFWFTPRVGGDKRVCFAARGHMGVCLRRSRAPGVQVTARWLAGGGKSAPRRCGRLRRTARKLLPKLEI